MQSITFEMYNKSTADYHDPSNDGFTDSELNGYLENQDGGSRMKDRRSKMEDQGSRIGRLGIK